MLQNIVIRILYYTMFFSKFQVYFLLQDCKSVKNLSMLSFLSTPAPIIGIIPLFCKTASWIGLGVGKNM